jgi:hypothetical protein
MTTVSLREPQAMIRVGGQVADTTSYYPDLLRGHAEISSTGSGRALVGQRGERAGETTPVRPRLPRNRPSTIPESGSPRERIFSG